LLSAVPVRRTRAKYVPAESGLITVSVAVPVLADVPITSPVSITPLLFASLMI
jgi:hypothetical protein